jgi:polyisoprenoid-binding protein YceI
MLTPIRTILACTCFAAIASAQPVKAADTWTVDPVHSSIIFKIFHGGAGYFFGHFEMFSGTITADAEHPELSGIELEIDAASVGTRNAKRDDHLRGPDFFNVVEYPTMRFESTSVSMVSDTAFDLTGDLTFHGETRPITVRVTKTGEKLSEEAGKSRAGFFTTFTIKRSDFGVSYGVDTGGLGDEVELIFSCEATR